MFEAKMEGSRIFRKKNAPMPKGDGRKIFTTIC